MYNGEFGVEIWSNTAEFLQAEPLNLVFSMLIEDRQTYDKINEAILLLFSFTTEGLCSRSYVSLP